MVYLRTLVLKDTDHSFTVSCGIVNIDMLIEHQTTTLSTCKDVFIWMKDQSARCFVPMNRKSCSPLT